MDIVRKYTSGSRNITVDVFIENSSVTTGAGLTGLVYNSAGLVCYYRKGATGTPTAISLVTQTVGGTHTDGGFVACDGTNTPGQYRLDLPDTIFAAPGQTTVHLKGATNMKPVTLTIQVEGDTTYNAVTFSVIGTAHKGSTTGITATTTAMSTVGADLIIANINSLSAQAAPTITDNYDNVWTLLRASTTVNWVRQTTYYCANPRTGASHTFTTGNGESPSIQVIALSGARLSGWSDQSAANTNSGTTIQAGSVTPSEENEIIVSFCTTGNTTTPSINLGYASFGEGTNSSGGNHIGGAIGYLVQTTAAASNPTWTVANGYNIAYNLTLKPRIAGDYVEITQFGDGQVYPLEYNLEYADLPMAGIYHGATPVRVEIETLDADTSERIQGYTALDAFTASGGAWSGTLRLVKTKKVTFTARSFSLTKQLATSQPTETTFGVGLLIALLGQSNQVHWFDAYGSPPAASDYTRMHTASGWASVTGNGARTYANALYAEHECMIGLLNYGVSGSALHQDAGVGNGYWLDATPGEPYDLFLTGLAAVGGRIHGVLWNQGEADAEISIAQATYLADLGTLYDNILSDAGATYDQLWFGTAILGPLLVGTDPYVSGIRQAQVYFGENTPGAFIAYSQLDGVLSDNYHYLSATWYERFANRAAQSTLAYQGLVAQNAKGPQLFRAFRRTGGQVIYLQCAGLAGDGLVENDGTTDGGSLTGFEVSNDSFATNLTIASTAFDGRFIELTITETLSGTVQVRYGYQQDVGVGNLPLRNLLPQGDTIGVPLLPFAATTVPISDAPDTTELAAVGTLPQVAPLSIGYTVYDRDGIEYQARSTADIALVDETDADATYAVAYTFDDAFDGGYIVLDNGTDTVTSNVTTASSQTDSARLQTCIETLLSLLPPGNDSGRTWVMRRTSGLIGTNKAIAKAAADTAQYWADVDRLLGENVSVGDVSDITVDWADGTVSTIETAGNMISFWLTGGTADGVEDTITITFLDSEANEVVCTCPLLVI